MTKLKASKKSGSVPNKALHSRVSYLYQAATYLATQQQHSGTATKSVKRTNQDTSEDHPEVGMKVSDEQYQVISRRLVADLRSVSLKVQMRMSPAMKHSICKNCGTLLIDGPTCCSEIENKSAGGKKAWADMLVRTCNICGFVRRFPLAMERQKKRAIRLPQRKEETKVYQAG